jgi:hypothetical protein
MTRPPYRQRSAQRSLAANKEWVHPSGDRRGSKRLAHRSTPLRSDRMNPEFSVVLVSKPHVRSPAKT